MFVHVIKFCVFADMFMFICVIREKDLLLQDLKTSTNDEEKRELQRRLEEVEREIQDRKRLISYWESRAKDHEERLGLLKEERECRT